MGLCALRGLCLGGARVTVCDVLSHGAWGAGRVLTRRCDGLAKGCDVEALQGRDVQHQAVLLRILGAQEQLVHQGERQATWSVK